MNRKGFAVTAVIYGLSILGILIVTILMGTLSSSRNNVSEEAKRVEKELISFNKSSAVYTTGEYYYTVQPGETGWYRIEGYGRSMMNAHGAYATGIIYLREGQVLFVSIPEEDTDSIIKIGSPEGPEILRVAGGYGEYPGGTLKVQCSEGVGGDLNLDNFQMKEGNRNLLGTNSVSYSQSDCYGAKSSYMAGYPGSGTAVNVDGFDYYFVDGYMMPAAHEGVGKIVVQLLSRQSDEVPTIPRANERFNGVRGIKITNNSGVSITDIVVTSHGQNVFYYSSTEGEGPGVPLVSPMSQTFDFELCDVDDVSVIFSTINNQYINNVEIQLVRDDGSLISIYRATESNTGTTSTPTGIKLSAYQPDSLSDLAKHGSYYISSVMNNNKVISARKDSETDSNPIGIEYINGDSRQRWSIDLITFSNVAIAGKKEYYITESSRYKSMSIYKDENLAKNRVAASMSFNTLSRNPPQIWTIHPMSDGTFAIRTVVPSYLYNKRTGFLTVNTSKNDDGSPSDYFEQLMIGYVEVTNVSSDDVTKPTVTERFQFYALDFSHTR